MLFIALVFSSQDNEKLGDESVHWLSSGDNIHFFF
jgi:hypothetical protein